LHYRRSQRDLGPNWNGAVLPETNRLRSKRDFKLTYKRGRSFVHPMLVLYVRPNREDACRIGFSISKKLGGSVERNRIKRRLREVFRANVMKLKPGFDVILVGRSRLKEAAFQAINDSVVEMLDRAKLMLEPAAPSVEKETCDP
jgi:ribonuclease P protein component